MVNTEKCPSCAELVAGTVVGSLAGIGLFWGVPILSNAILQAMKVVEANLRPVELPSSLSDKGISAVHLIACTIGTVCFAIIVLLIRDKTPPIEGRDFERVLVNPRTGKPYTNDWGQPVRFHPGQTDYWMCEYYQKPRLDKHGMLDNNHRTYDDDGHETNAEPIN